MAYLHGPTPDASPSSDGRKKSGSTSRHIIIRKPMPPLSRAIRGTNLSFEDLIQKYKPGIGAKTKKKTKDEKLE
jgi:hypothetical protein